MKDAAETKKRAEPFFLDKFEAPLIPIRLGSSELSTAKSEQRKAIALAANVEQRKSESNESDWREEE